MKVKKVLLRRKIEKEKKREEKKVAAINIFINNYDLFFKI